MEPTRLFLSVLEELQECVMIAKDDPARQEYHAIRTSRLLRQLLLDSNSLIDRVNREFRIKIKYGVGRTWEDDFLPNSPFARSYRNKTLTMWMIADTFYPPIAEKMGLLPNGTKFLNRDDFLATPMMYVPDQFLTVRQLILHAANVKGGTHLGVPKSEADKAAEGIHDSVFMVGTPATLNAIVTIGQVVVDSLAPLKSAIVSKPK